MKCGFFTKCKDSKDLSFISRSRAIDITDITESLFGKKGTPYEL